MLLSRACRSLMLLAWVVHIPLATGQSADPLIPAVVFLRADGSKPKVGSGFLIRADDEARVFLVTAAHVAASMGKGGWSLYILGPGGEPQPLSVKSADWQVSDDADVAIVELPLSEGNRDGLLARSAPAKVLTRRPLPPKRDVVLTAMGFPRALGRNRPNRQIPRGVGNLQPSRP